MAGLAKTLNAVEEYYAAVPPSTDKDTAALANAKALRGLLDGGNKGLLQCQQPNGQWPANGDNNREGFAYDHGVSAGIAVAGKAIAVVRTNTSGFLPAYGHLALRSDGGGDAAQLQLDYQHSGGYHHMPPAVNAIQLTAFGRTVLDHFRYERTRLRNRNGYTGGSNTVAINQHSQWPTTVEDGTARGAKGSIAKATQSNGAVHPVLPMHNTEAGSNYAAKGGDCVLFQDGRTTEGFSVAEVDGYRAYYPWTKAGDYQRVGLHNTRDASHPYAITKHSGNIS